MSYEEKEIDHEYTNEIVCPFCGYEFIDSWEYGDGEEDLGLIECNECGKSFYANREVLVTYSTCKANYGTCKHCKEDNVVIKDYNSTLGKYSSLCVKCGELEKQRLLKEYFDSIHNKKGV
ncbi:TPA: hypothetical protein PTV74_002117 [Clostridium botulinum]|nr:hypothetical protein [Clostridium botulinum]HDK7186760.1 hypothetical protein [Clostridium botulinum]HDK7193286.1 hypothetical protein [Clostridium botulinum]HDK7205136.1 hypothetical protein [Clostridium botulinum]HDK7209156.1 hypothetical protein [Clostridium botulinum]